MAYRRKRIHGEKSSEMRACGRDEMRRVIKLKCETGEMMVT
jgi:hypothetical protein